ncbi:MAG: SH3 domain-containing protein [Lachnospiraceae bacterium]|nr:SH3 domain-containing protein [Lachnospiraceae bacterium]
MKVIFKKFSVLLAAAVLMLSVLVVPAQADSVDYDDADYYVIVQAQDGSGYLYLRRRPSVEDTILCNIYDGTVLHITAVSEDWTGVVWGLTRYEGQHGWVSLKHTVEYTPSNGGASHSSEGVAVDYDVVVQAVDGTDYLYLRSGPGMDYRILCNVYDGEYLHITNEVGDSGGDFTWGKTVFNGQEGWVSLKQTVSRAVYEKEQPTPTPTKEPKPEKTPVPDKDATRKSEVTASDSEKTETQESVQDKKQEENGVKESNSFDKKILIMSVAAIVLVIAAIVALLGMKNKR